LEGLGVIYALVPKNQTVLVAFASGCVNMSPAQLEHLGDIRIFEAVPMMARAVDPVPRSLPPPG
jgi:hypothetical protein